MKTNQERFKLFESILTYAVDENPDSAVHEYEELFNEKVFFENAYIDRSKKEIELEDEILKDSEHTYFIGQPGTGKTTILRKVLNKINKDREALLFQFDFKKIPLINNEANTSFENMLQFLTEFIKERIEYDYIIDKIDVKKIILFFLEDRNKKSNELNNPAFTKYLSQLSTEYSLDLSNDKGKFTEWLRIQFFRKLPDNIKNIIRELSSTLQPHNYLYYLAHESEKQKVCIIVFDNVDSILNTEIRSTFMKVIRNGFNNYKSSSRIVCAIREKNIVNYSDIGSFIINEVNLDYNDLIHSVLLDKELKDLDPDNEQFEEEKNFIELKYQKKAKEQFAKLIYERRFKYFKNLGKAEGDSLDELQYYYQLILDDDWLSVAFFDLCNLDRRKMLIEISSFISYIVFDKNLKIEDLKLNKPQIGTILQTCFYGWVKETKKFYEDEIYNIPKDVYKWRKGDFNVIGCNIDHLIFCVIFNLSKQAYPTYSFGRKASLKEVLNLLIELGYDSAYLKERINFLHKETTSGLHKGLLEFYTSDHKLTAEENEQISLTPRSYYLLVFSSLKFVSVFADLREEERLIYNGKDFKKYENDLEPVTKPKLLLYLYFLCDLAKLHMESLSNIKSKLYSVHLDSWLDYYRRAFCLKTSYEQVNKNSVGELLINNLLTSNIKFLYTQQEVEANIHGGSVRRIRNDVIEQFKVLQRNFNKEIHKLLETADYDPQKADFAKHIQFDALH